MSVWPSFVFPRALALALTFVLAGCSGSVVPAPAFRSATPQPVAPVGTPASKATLRFAVTIPAPTTAAAQTRRPAYVSPATNSLSLSQNGGPAQVVSLVPTSSQCSTASGTRVCSVTLAVTAGANQLLSLATYASSDGSGPALSTQHLVTSIFSGQSNQIAVTLNGVVAAIALALQQTALPAGTPGTDAVIVNALDASGQTIVGPGVFADANGDPIQVVLSDSDTTGATSLAQTTVTQATTVSLTYTGAASLASATITASAGVLAAARVQLSITPRGAALTNGEINALIDTVGPMFDALPHQSLIDDLNVLAQQMVATGNFPVAQAYEGGIAAILTDGTPVTIFADHQEELPYAPVAQAVQRRAVTTANDRARPASLTPGNAHEVAFMVNFTGGSAFTPSRQVAYANAFARSGFLANGHGVDTIDASLDAILALGAGRSIDFLSIATHGGFSAGRNGDQNPLDDNPNKVYVWNSETPTTDANLTTYAADVAAGTLHYGYDLNDQAATRQPKFAFTAGFLAEHMKFGAGSIVDNESCFGGKSWAVSGNYAVNSVLAAANVERYFGWTNPVIGGDADGTDAYIVDRMLGERSPSMTGLDQFAPPTMPLSVPQTLDATFQQMSTTTRNDPESVSTKGTYLQTYDAPLSQQNGTPTYANLVFIDAGISSFSLRPIEWGLPSIAGLQLQNGTLTLGGTFPVTRGTVQITDGSGIAHVLQPLTWTTGQVTVTPPASGPGASGNVQAVSADGIAGNPYLLQLVSFAPTIVNLDYGASQLFTVTIQPTPTDPAAVSYQWSLDGGKGGNTGGVLADPLSAHTNLFVTTSNSAIYTAPALKDPSQPENTATFDNVSVIVTDSSGGKPVSLGTFGASIGVGCDMYGIPTGPTRVCL